MWLPASGVWGEHMVRRIIHVMEAGRNDARAHRGEYN